MPICHHYLFNGEACGSLEEMFARYGNASHDARLSLVGENGMHMQSVPAGNGLHYCGVGDTAHEYVCPHEMMMEELEEEFRRFDSGMDYSFVAQQWEACERSSSPLFAIAVWVGVAALIDAAIILSFTGLPENSHLLFSFMANFCAVFLFG